MRGPRRQVKFVFCRQGQTHPGQHRVGATAVQPRVFDARPHTSPELLAFQPVTIDSLATGHFPGRFKDAFITPIVKKAGAHFSPWTSTESAVLHVLSDVLLAVDRGDFAALALLDLSAAFDTVDYNILLQRLQTSYGINVSALQWFWSYLVGRTQRVRHGAIISASAQRSLSGSYLHFITFRLDYCNSLLAGAPQSTLGVLQCVQNATARLIFKLRPRDHVTDSLIQLHWLPIRWRVQYKLVMLMYGIVVGMCPEYLRTIVEPAMSSHPGLRSHSVNSDIASGESLRLCIFK